MLSSSLLPWCNHFSLLWYFLTSFWPREGSVVADCLLNSSYTFRPSHSVDLQFILLEVGAYCTSQVTEACKVKPLISKQLKDELKRRVLFWWSIPSTLRGLQGPIQAAGDLATFCACTCLLKGGREWGEACAVPFFFSWTIEILHKQSTKCRHCWGGGGCRYLH